MSVAAHDLPTAIPGAVAVGDIFVLPEQYGATGDGYHWASRIVDLDGDGTLWMRFFTVAYTTTKAAPGAGTLLKTEGLEAMVAPLVLCQRVDPKKRATICRLIDPEVLKRLPGVEAETSTDPSAQQTESVRADVSASDPPQAEEREEPVSRPVEPSGDGLGVVYLVLVGIAVAFVLWLLLR